MNHPLTDEMCEEFRKRSSDSWEDGIFNCDEMRSAADWQLERCIEWLKDELD